MRVFTNIPEHMPETPLLDKIQTPQDLKQLAANQLTALADELREFLIYSVHQSGGHFAAGLGVIELTLALHYVFHMPEDKIIWDVGHQAYPHKILTGRKDQLATIRRQHGLSPFPKRKESIYDIFGTGHSSTSISAALGMAVADRLHQRKCHNIAVIGDGAMTAGMVFEAMNHAGDIKPNLLVILNDNDMSISRNVGALSSYFAQLFSGKMYTGVRALIKKLFGHMPWALDVAKRVEVNSKGFVVPPSNLFEAMGFNYIGPVDGHDLDILTKTLTNMQALSGPQLLHIKTVKGKGFLPAEHQPVTYHAVKAVPSATMQKTPKKTTEDTAKTAVPTYSNIFGQWLCDMAAKDDRLIGITPAMCEGSDMIAFSERFPDRYFDVAIAEQHAVTFAAGFSIEGFKPVVGIYSTFLQRAYDQLIHDVSIQQLDLLLAVDRAGLVGEDGATHDGSFDLSFLHCIPELIVMAPSCAEEAYQMLTTGYLHPGPVVVRYPKGYTDQAITKRHATHVDAVDVQDKQPVIPLGKAEQIYHTECTHHKHIHDHYIKHVVIFAFGSMVHPAIQAVQSIEKQSMEAGRVADGLDIRVINMRFIKPLDTDLIRQMAMQAELIVTIEENSLTGGVGSAVNQILIHANLAGNKTIRNIGLPDRFFNHATRAQNLAEAGLDVAGIQQSLLRFITE